jgi:hypothetical protein
MRLRTPGRTLAAATVAATLATVLAAYMAPASAATHAVDTHAVDTHAVDTNAVDTHAAAINAAGVTASAVPRFDHVVIAVMENKKYSQVIGNSSAPYINSLAKSGANFTSSHGVAHPSQPNYIAMFSGSTQGVVSDACPKNFRGRANLGRQLLDAGFSFAGYSEDQPSAGYTGCTMGGYARKHNPWVDFDNVPAASNQPYTAFPTDYAKLPTVSYVIPNLCNDMHDCSVATGDAWLKRNLDGYVQWAKTHNSLFILTWDEDDFGASNQIVTVFAGPNVRPGDVSQNINHYNVLRTIEDMYGLAPLGKAASATPITSIWG